MKSQHNLGPTRILVRDSFLTEASVQRLAPLAERGTQYATLKTENSIDRRTGRALNPRQQEVLPPGCEFELRIDVRIFQGDKEDQFKTWLQEALNLLSKEAIGAGGSRGYGWVELKYEIRDA